MWERAQPSNALTVFKIKTLFNSYLFFALPLSNDWAPWYRENALFYCIWIECWMNEQIVCYKIDATMPSRRFYSCFIFIIIVIVISIAAHTSRSGLLLRSFWAGTFCDINWGHTSTFNKQMMVNLAPCHIVFYCWMCTVLNSPGEERSNQKC